MVIILDFTQGNISTIAVWIYVLISPLLVKYGINIDEATFTTFFVALVGIILAVWSSYNPNTFKFLGNKKAEPVTDDGVLNDEYVTGDDDDC
jgi:hypothetical protein